MSEEKLTVGEISKPRFEFRTFGKDFFLQAGRMAELSAPVPDHVKVRHSEEIYIISRTNNINNTKIRTGKMDIKTYIQTIDDLEQWNPLTKTEFPVPSELLKTNIFPAFQVSMPTFEQNEYAQDEFLSLINNHQDLQAVDVVKERFGYMVHNTICEVANVVIDGKKSVTINSESTEIEDIKKTLEDVGLGELENINYLQAIKRIIGMINKPLAN